MARRAITERTTEEILTRIDAMTAPGHMTKGEAVETLDDLRSQLGDRIEALRDEIADGYRGENDDA